MRSKRTVSVLLLLSLLVITGGCASSFMVPTSAFEPGPDFAVVNFLRPSSFGGAIKFGIWDKENLIGVLTPKHYIQYKASPGEHIFMARAENWAIVKAKVEAGKTYYILAEPRMGVWKARIAMSVLNPGDRRLGKWMRMKPIAVDPAKRDAYVSEHLPGVRKAIENVEQGKAEFATMNPSDGK